MSYRYVLPPDDHLAWLADALAWRGNAVASMVPPGPGTVLRLRHPAFRLDGAGRPEILRWADAVPGRTVTSASQFSDLVDDLDYDNGPREQGGPWNVGPAKGTLPQAMAIDLAAALPPSRSWRFGIWAGWASVSPPADSDTMFSAADRAYFLLQGTAEDVGRSLSPSDWRAPNLWWDEERSWWVRTDIDRADTFVAASREVADRILLQLACYECSEADRDDPLYALTRT